MAFYPYLPLLTDRLCLRPFSRGDVDAVHAYRGREDVARYLYDPPLSRQECELAIQRRVSQTVLEEEGDRLVLACETLDGGVLIGELSLTWRSVEARQGELGWIFHPDFQGQGYASEGTRALMALAFRQLDLHRVYARCDARNEPSWRLMERLGMRREAHFREHGLFKGGWDEEFHYALLRREWLALRHSGEEV